VGFAPEELSRILPIVPIIIGVLRKNDRKAADLLLKSADAEEVDNALGILHEDVKIDQRQFTVTQLRFGMLEHGDDIWAEAIKAVLTGCSPRLISEDVAIKLLKAYQEKAQDINSSDKSCGGKLGPILDDLPRTRFQVLGELCALIRDTSSNAKKVADSIAENLLCPDGLPSGVSKDNVLDLFQVMVTKAEPLFGRPGAKR